MGQKKAEPQSETHMAEHLARVSERWPGSLGILFILFPRVAELQGKYFGSF